MLIWLKVLLSCDQSQKSPQSCTEWEMFTIRQAILNKTVLCCYTTVMLWYFDVLWYLHGARNYLKKCKCCGIIKVCTNKSDILKSFLLASISQTAVDVLLMAGI